MEYEQRAAPERAGAFVAKSQLLSDADVDRALTRMAHEIVERNHDAEALSLIGLQTGGEPFAGRLTALLSEVTGHAPSLGLLDVSFYRDDLSLQPGATIVGHRSSTMTSPTALWSWSTTSSSPGAPSAPP